MTQLDAQTFLYLCEQSNELAFWDIETTGRNPDYNSVLVISVLPYKDLMPATFVVKQPGRDSLVLREAVKLLEGYTCWVTFYGRGFDVPFVEGRLLKHNMPPLDKQLHLDMYWKLKSVTNTERKSQAHYLRWLQLDNKKMDVSPDEWNKGNLKIIKERCESDVIGLRELYDRTKNRVKDVTR